MISEHKKFRVGNIFARVDSTGDLFYILSAVGIDKFGTTFALISSEGTRVTNPRSFTSFVVLETHLPGSFIRALCGDNDGFEFVAESFSEWLKIRNSK